MLIKLWKYKNNESTQQRLHVPIWKDKNPKMFSGLKNWL